jgi:hypothetical protein
VAAVEPDAGAAVVVDAVFEQGCGSVSLETGGDGGGPLEASCGTALAPSRNGAMLAVSLTGEAPTMRARAVVLAAALVMAPLGAWAADFVAWWEEGFSPQATEAVVEIGAAFEQKTGKDVEIVFQTPRRC